MDAAITAGRRGPGDELSTIDFYSYLKSVMFGTATNIFVPSGKKNRNDWFYDEYKLAAEWTNAAY